MADVTAFLTGPGESVSAGGATFYPKDFAVATLQSEEAARKAAEAAQAAGFASGDVLAASAADMLQFFEKFRSETGAWGQALQALSRFIDTETKFADADIELAKQGAGFVLVRCKTEGESHRLASVMEPFHLIAMQWYRPSGVESLA